MIRINNLTKRYGERSVLQDVSLHIREGEFVFLQGRSGSGKSTLLKLLYRDIGDFSGQIEVAGSPIELIPKYLLRRRMGVIFQSFELLERKSVFENVALAGEVLGRDRKQIEPDVVRLLERVGLKGAEHLFPDQLSGGEQQRVAIVRALLNRPCIVLADEPTGNLDSETALDMLELLKGLQEEENISMLIVTHSERLIEEFPSRTLLMDKGRVREHEHI
jgi:cell division transport system ATP-binding protein